MARNLAHISIAISDKGISCFDTELSGRVSHWTRIELVYEFKTRAFCEVESWISRDRKFQLLQLSRQTRLALF